MNVHDSMVVRYSADLENETFAMYLKPDTEECERKHLSILPQYLCR